MGRTQDHLLPWDGVARLHNRSYGIMPRTDDCAPVIKLFTVLYVFDRIFKGVAPSATECADLIASKDRSHVFSGKTFDQKVRAASHPPRRWSRPPTNNCAGTRHTCMLFALSRARARARVA